MDPPLALAIGVPVTSRELLHHQHQHRQQRQQDHPNPRMDNAATGCGICLVVCSPLIACLAGIAACLTCGFCCMCCGLCLPDEATRLSSTRVSPAPSIPPTLMVARA